MKKNNNILLISNMYPDENAPNYGVFVKNTNDILSRNNYKIDKIIINKHNSKITKLFSYIKHYLCIIKLGLKDKYRILYVHYGAHNSIPIIILNKLNKNIKICTNLHGSDVIPENKIHKFFQPYVRKLLEISDFIIVPSNYYKNIVSSKYSIKGSKIKVFPSGGINSSTFYRDKEIKKEKYIGFVGRIEFKKGWDIFLKFIANAKNMPQFKDYKFIVVGDGKQKNEFNNLIKLLDIDEKIEMHNMLTQAELNKIYNKMELFCFPTMREGESLGLVGLEAMACGTPVIGSNIGGLKDYIVNGKNGYLFEPGNVSELTEFILSFVSKLENEKLKFQENAINTSKKYDVRNISEILVKIFEEI